MPNHVDFSTIKRPQIFVLTQAGNKTEKIPIFISVLREKIDINRFEQMEKTDSSSNQHVVILDIEYFVFDFV